MIYSLSEFKTDPQEWERYTYAHVTAMIDKNGEIQRLLNKKARISPKNKSICIERYLDG